MINPVDEEELRLNPWTERLVNDFCSALKDKLLAAQIKYHYDDGWRDSNWQQECLKKFKSHIEKGDPRDVAAYCAFMWFHGWTTNGKPRD